MTCGAHSATDTFTIEREPPYLQSDKSVYMADSDMIITVIDPDANMDGEVAEYAGDREDSKLVIESDYGRIDGYRLKETDISTGIFQGIIEVRKYDKDGSENGERGNNDTNAAYGTGGEDGFIACRRGEEIRIKYTNKTDTAALEVYLSDFGAAVEMDQDAYMCNSRVRITIVAPDAIRSDRAGHIGTKKDCMVSIRTGAGRLDKYMMVETGEETGVFTGEIRLTGFAGMGKNANTYADVDERMFGTTGGKGPNDGMLACGATDSIEVTFDLDGEQFKADAPIRWNIGQIAFMRQVYKIGETAIVVVTDPDMGRDPDAKDKIRIRVWSDSDKDGIWITVRETDPTSGTFIGEILLDSMHSSQDAAKILVADGDKVRAEYEDSTLPHPYGPQDTINMTSTTTVSSSGTVTPPLERATMELAIRNERTGTESIIRGDTVAVTVKATILKKPIPFVVILQIQDMAETTNEVMHHSLDPKSGMMEHTFGWKPSKSDVFKITAFLWESMNDPTPLCEPVTRDVNVV